MTKKEWLRQFISNFIDGPNVDAFLSSLADEAERMEQLSIAVSNCLTISTSSGIYLDKNLSQLGIVRPPELGMDDLAFQRMGIQINAQKQITDVIHTVLETFFGSEAVRAYTQCTQPAPYYLQDGDDLLVQFENSETISIPFSATDFKNINEATAAEVSNVITRYLAAQNLSGYSTVVQDQDSGLSYVRIFGGAKGPYSMVKVMGGRVQSELEWPTMRDTDLGIGNNTTNWMITRTVGSTYRFRWYSGPKPSLVDVQPGDNVMIYGPQFDLLGINGTFAVKAVRPPSSTPSDYTSGYFEIDMETFYGLKASKPDIAPPPNTPGNTYSYVVSQASYSDLKFFLPTKSTSYSQNRYALAWETNKNTLKIYVPATTKIVKRDLIGAAHLHMLYQSTDFTSSFGSTNPDDVQNQVEIISDRVIKFKQSGYDNIGYGGTLTYSNPGVITIPIEYVARENGYTQVVCKEPHLIPTKSWKMSLNYSINDTVIYNGYEYTAIANSGPLSVGGIRQPDEEQEFWVYSRPAKDLSTIVVSIQPDLVPADDNANTFLGPYIIDPAASYALTSQSVTTQENILAGEQITTLFCKGTLPNETGILLFSLNNDQQEGPVRYFGAQLISSPDSVSINTISQVGNTLTVTTTQPHSLVPGSGVLIQGVSVPNLNGTFTVSTTPNSTTYTANSLLSQVTSATGGTSTAILAEAACTLLIDPSYSFKYDHDINTDVTLLSDRKAYTPDVLGSDYGVYITDSAAGRVFAETLIRQITALGINVEIVVMYPSDVGLGNAGESTLDNVTPQSDAVYVWGPAG